MSKTEKRQNLSKSNFLHKYSKSQTANVCKKNFITHLLPAQATTLSIPSCFSCISQSNNLLNTGSTYQRRSLVFFELISVFLSHLGCWFHADPVGMWTWQFEREEADGWLTQAKTLNAAASSGFLTFLMTSVTITSDYQSRILKNQHTYEAVWDCNLTPCQPALL